MLKDYEQVKESRKQVLSAIGCIAICFVMGAVIALAWVS